MKKERLGKPDYASIEDRRGKYSGVTVNTYSKVDRPGAQIVTSEFKMPREDVPYSTERLKRDKPEKNMGYNQESLNSMVEALKKMGYGKKKKK